MHFYVVFPCFDPPECTGQYFFEKYLKTSSKLVWTLLRRFWTPLRNQIFFVFSTNFYKIRSPGCTGQENFGKNYLKQVWTLLERFFGILELWNLFDFCGFFLSLLCALGTAFSVEKLNQNILKQCFWEHFRTILKVSKFLFFFKVFSKLRPSKVHWRLFFETKLPQNRFKTCLDNFRDSFGHFRNIEFFHFFQSFPYSTLQGALCKIFTEKITSTHVQNMFDCFWERFLGILKNWRFFQFFGVFPSFDSPGCTGHFFPKKSPQNNFKTCLDTFRNVFGHFWNFKLFSILFRIFPSFDPPGCTGHFFFTKKKYLEECWKRVWTLLGKILVILKKKWKFFNFS